jgi:exonuclease SbcC
MDLEAITISNFRSIRGSVTVPLDAPVVLIHGLNGAGKTSVLAAIELALTGQFAGAAPPQPGVLVHRGSKQTTIQLDTSDGTASGKLSAEGLDLSPMLGEREARFYTERCYLTQARLGRLLEIYQSAEGRADTPLTRFIKDLLRLDRLDALADGLHAVADKRNLRKLVPRYGEVERELTNVGTAASP